ncbi:hypothetical protein P9112_003527 [Eukaryota sp. TZLM1-RC]
MTMSMDAGEKRHGALDTPDTKRRRMDSFNLSSLSSEDLTYPKLRPDWESLSLESKRERLNNYIYILEQLLSITPSVHDPTTGPPQTASYAALPPTPQPVQSMYTPPAPRSQPRTKPSSKTSAKKKGSSARPKRPPVPSPKQYIAIPVPDSHARPGGKRPATDAYMNTCLQIVSKLLQDPQGGGLFSSPVDPNTCGAPDYYDRISNPMDLGTVKARLLNGYYRSVEEFAADCRLTFDNSLSFNPKDHPVHLLASHMKTKFEQAFAEALPVAVPTPKPEQAADIAKELAATQSKMFADVKVPDLPAPPSEQKTSSTQPSTSSVASAETQPAVTSPAMTQPLPPQPTTTALQAPQPQQSQNGVRELTFNEKSQLREDIHKAMDEEESWADTILDIISKHAPDPEDDSEEVEVDLGTLSREALWELYSFVNGQKKEKKQSGGDSDYE